ncbi:hypothetical protein RFI_15551, partial [Reticulomyxa filosa]
FQVAEKYKDIVATAFKSNAIDGKTFISYVVQVDDLIQLNIPKITATQIFNAYHTSYSEQIMPLLNKNCNNAKKSDDPFLCSVMGGVNPKQIKVEKTMTVADVKAIIRDTLDLEWKNNSLKCSGLMESDIRSRQIVKADKSPFKYYKVFPGLNYEGTCKNRSCDAYGQKVITERGFGDKIYPLYEEIEEKINCPGCKQSYEVDCYNLFECRATITYTLEKSKTKRTDQLEATEDNIVVLGEGKKKIEYGFLALTVTEL